MGRSFGRDHRYGGRSTQAVDVAAPLLGGGSPLLLGLAFAPIGIYFVAQGDATETLGWIFAIIGATLVIAGIVVGIVLWPERAPSRDN